MPKISDESALAFLKGEELQEDYEENTPVKDISFVLLCDIYGLNRSGSEDPVRFRKKDLIKAFEYLGNEEGFNETYLKMDEDYMYIPRRESSVSKKHKTEDESD